MVEAVMSVISSKDDFGPDKAVAVEILPRRGFDVEETYWGYIIKGTERAPVWLVASQAASWAVGVVFAIVAVGMLVVPGTGDALELALFKVAASVPLAVVAVMLFWYASRGTRIEVEIDTSRGEVREMLRNQSGRSTLLGLYGFDSIGGVFLERNREERNRSKGRAALVLRYRNTAQVLRVARGAEPMLEGLRDRLGRDLMVRKRKADRLIESAMAAAA
jgi:hypothetical protein